MADPASVHLAEYEALRREIELRATLSSTLIALELSALGFGLYTARESLELLGGLGFISVVLWLFWLDHTEQIYKLAAYTSLRLGPALKKQTGAGLGWETFLREIDRMSVVRSTASIGVYVTALFGLAPPFLASVLVYRALHAGPELDLLMGVRLVEGVVVLAVWAVALSQYRRFLRSRDQVDSWIGDPQSFDSASERHIPEGPQDSIDRVHEAPPEP